TSAIYLLSLHDALPIFEKRIAASAEAYQRPIIRKKISDLVEYYSQCADTGNLPAIPGAVLLVADRRLEFTPTSSHRVLGVLEIRSEEHTSELQSRGHLV